MPGTSTTKDPFSINKLLLPRPAPIFYVGLLPPLLLGVLASYDLNLAIWWHLLLLPAVVYIGIIITIQGITLIPALIVKAFHITYAPGLHTYNYHDKDAFKWIINPQPLHPRTQHLRNPPPRQDQKGVLPTPRHENRP